MSDKIGMVGLGIGKRGPYLIATPVGRPTSLGHQQGYVVEAEGGNGGVDGVHLGIEHVVCSR